MAYGVYAENESGFVQIDSEYDNLAVLETGIAYAEYKLMAVGGSWEPPFQNPDSIIRVPIDTGAKYSELSHIVPGIYPSYDEDDFGWHQLPENLPDDFTIFVKPAFEANWTHEMSSLRNAERTETDPNSLGSAWHISYEEKTSWGRKWIKFLGPYEGPLDNAAWRRWYTRVIQYAIAIKHSDWIAINGEPTALKNVQQVADISTVHTWPTWFGGLGGRINQPLLTPEVEVGPQYTFPSYLNFNPASPQVTPSVKYTVGLQFDPETKVLTFEWHDVQEDINPFEYFKITGNLAIGLTEEDTTFNKSSATKYIETRNIYGGLDTVFGSTTVVHKWEWVTSNAFRARLQAVNHISYTIEIYADAQYFGLDVRKQDGGLCYSSETPQMRVQTTSSVRVHDQVNYFDTIANVYLTTYHADGRGIWALLKPFNAAGIMAIDASTGYGNILGQFKNFFLTFEYAHAVNTDPFLNPGFSSEIDAAQDADPSVYISAYITDLDFRKIDAGYDLNGVGNGFPVFYPLLGHKTMITGYIV